MTYHSVNLAATSEKQSKFAKAKIAKWKTPSPDEICHASYAEHHEKTVTS